MISIKSDDNGTFYELDGEKLYFGKKEDLKYLMMEEHQYKQYIKEIDKESIIYDVGAYHGFYSILGGALGEKVYSFEANPNNLKILRENKSLNSEKDITVVDKAVWSEETELKLNTQIIGGKSHIADERVTIDPVTLDNFAETHSNPDIIKIDVEGAEHHVLRGAENILKNTNPVLFIEIHLDGRLEEFRSSKEELETYLSKLGYSKVFHTYRGDEILGKYVKNTSS